MFARHWRLTVAPERIDELLRTIDSLLPAVRRLWGFRGLLILRAEAEGKISEDVEVLSLWESLEAMRSSEKNMLLYQAMMRLKACAQGFPSIREHRVLASDLPGVPNVA